MMPTTIERIKFENTVNADRILPKRVALKSDVAI
jgi:hypothetical protein